MKTTPRYIGATLIVASLLSSCTITPDQAAKLEILHKIYDLTVTVQK